jgi:hypothetical protein
MQPTAPAVMRRHQQLNHQPSLHQTQWKSGLKEGQGGEPECRKGMVVLAFHNL